MRALPPNSALSNVATSITNVRGNVVTARSRSRGREDQDRGLRRRTVANDQHNDRSRESHDSCKTSQPHDSPNMTCEVSQTSPPRTEEAVASLQASHLAAWNQNKTLEPKRQRTSSWKSTRARKSQSLEPRKWTVKEPKVFKYNLPFTSKSTTLEIQNDCFDL